MSTTDINEPIPVTAILAKLILLQHNNQLPPIADFDTDAIAPETPTRITVWLRSAEDVETWVHCLGHDPTTIKIWDHADPRNEWRDLYLKIEDWDGTGWKVEPCCRVARVTTPPTPLDVETVAALEAVASA